MFKSFYKGKKVLVTGHTGFKGSWLTCWLLLLGAKVYGYSDSSKTSPSHFNLLEIKNEIIHRTGDIRDLEKLKQFIIEVQPDVVFHLAAQAIVSSSYKNPLLTISTNIVGTANLMESLRILTKKVVVVLITSDKCYENKEWIWGYRENDRLGGHDPYSASKGAAEIIFSAYLRSFFESGNLIGAASTRAGNVIGGGDWAIDRLIPDCIRSIDKNIPIEIRNPLATRPWQHVLEPLSGYILLSAKLRENPKRYSGSWNFGPSSSEVRTVNEVASKIIDHFGKGKIKVTDARKQHHEAMLLQLNCDKSHQILKWEPRWTVEETLKYTSDWYKKVLDGESAEEITKLQIDKYFN